MSLLKRLTSKGPKRILALDGGGVRGMITLGFLERIEQILRDRHERPNLKLCDYFDLIGGTSTGSIIASGLAIGMDVTAIKQMYFEMGERVFGKKKWKKWVALFDPAPLKVGLERIFGERTLGDPSIKTGLCVITKRADTGSTWPLLNHPRGKYYRYNYRILLRDAIRASTAAPTFFVPEKFDVGQGQIGAFVDGGVSMANDPALQLFLIATLKGFPFRWPTGEDRLLLVSIGTGVWLRQNTVEYVINSRLWDWAWQIPSMLMEDAAWQNQLILQYLSRTPTRWPIDKEVGDLSSDLLTPEPALSYLRYNAWLTPESLQQMGVNAPPPKLKSLRDMSAARNLPELAKIGEKAAQRQVRDTHFPEAFDLK